MNINPVSFNSANFCALPTKQAEIPSEQYIYKTVSENQGDSPQISNKEKFLNACSKVKTACIKGAKFVKENKSAIGAGAIALGKGLLASCTVLGATQLANKIFKADVEKFAGKLAVIGGVAMTAADAIKNKDKFVKNKES
ncbi:MAG: hypothetical protein ACI37S_01010 [Candidatus Gastranaerophilaceae bacterium]